MSESLLLPLVHRVAGKAADALVVNMTSMCGLDDDRQLLERHLLAIECKLANTEERSETNAYVKSWMKELKSVTYEASDVLDDFQYEALLRQSKISGSTSRKLLSYITHRIPLFFRLEMSKKLKNVLKKINKLVVEMNKFGLESSVHRVEQQLPWRQMHFNLDNSTKIFGRDDDKEVLVKLLLDQQDQQKVRVLPIVGMGGIGKTTLAKMVYNDQQVQQHFQLKMWHCVSDNFDAIALVKSIIELATNRSCDLPDSIEPLQERLEQVIGRIRFLLVLDDVWNEDKRMWEDALKPLLCSVGGPGSVIVVTCRSKQVASIMCTVEPHEVVFLSQEDSWELFSNKAFSHGVEEQAELVSIGRRIVNKCGGLPLALKTMGGLLSSKQQVQEWKAIEKSKIWNSHGGNEVMDALKLSYRHLSSEMKQCFAFCAVFPKDYEIEKDRLIQLWMANGLIQEEGTMDLTQKGEFIFNQLVLMSFLQDKKMVVKSAVYTVYGDNTQYETIVCKMHDLMHDLAKDFTDECPSIEELTQQKTLLKDVCHMQMSKAELEQIRVLCKGRTNLRTLLVPSESYEDRYNFWSRLHKDVKDLLQESASLRALHCSPSSIVICKAINAKHLRYLDLSGSDIVALPDSICVLYNLQTLRLIDCKELRQLSKDMAGLRKLMHLYLYGCDRLESMSPNFGLLNSLYILTTFVVDTGDGLGIEQLKGLQHLSNRLELLNLKKIKSGENAKEANLNQKQNLSELLFSWDQEIDDGPKNMAYNVEEVLQCLEPHSNIQKLEIRGYGGLEISQWMRKPHMFNYLRELKISNCPRCKSIPVVWLSVSLEMLSLQKMDNLTTLCNNLDVVSGGITPVQIFPRLKRMMLIELRSLEIWAENSVGEPDDSLVTFPMVEELRIENCPKLASIPVTPIVSELTIVGVHSTIVGLVFMNIRLGYWPSLVSLTLGSPEEIPMLPLDAQQSRSQRSLEKLKRLALEGPNSLVTTSDLSRSHLMPWKCFPFVEELAIQRCSNLVRWPTEGLRCLDRLRSLYISRCENLEGNTSSFEETLPLSLEYLMISDCNSVAKLPSNLGNLAKLRSLDVIGCCGLKGLPNGMGGLTSLRELVIVDCPAMEKFPHGLLERLPALEHLGIFACPELKRRCREGGEYFHLVSSVPLIIFDDDSHENPSCEVTRYTQERLGQYIRKPPRYKGGNGRTVRGGLNSKRPLITEASTEYAVKQSGAQEQDGNNIVLEETTSSNVSRLFDVSIEDVGEVRETGGPISALLDTKRPLITEASAESAAKQSGGQERDGNNIVLEETTSNISTLLDVSIEDLGEVRETGGPISVSLDAKRPLIAEASTESAAKQSGGQERHGNNIVLEETTSPNISTLFDVSIEDIGDLRETGGPISASLDAKRPIVTEASAEFAAKQSGGQKRDGNNIVLEETPSSNISRLFDVSVEDVGEVRETGGLISSSRGAKRPLIIEASARCAVEQSGTLERDRNNTVLEEARILTSSNVSTLLDGPVSVSLSAMRALGAKLDMLLLAPPRGCSSKSVKDGMQLLREDVEEISSYLDELSELEEPPPTAKCWMNEAHDLSYDIEDYIDSLLFVQPAESSNNIKGTRPRLKLSGHAKTSKRLKPRHEGTAGRVSQFSLFVQKAIERHQRYDLHSCSNLRRRFVSLGPMLPMQYGEETTHIVIDGRMNEFIKSLENDEGKQFKVMSVHGSSGLGKTTLARALYNKVGKSFQCRAFIRVSEQPDTKRIFHDMLSQLQRQHPTPDCKETGLIDNIKTHLQDKRYLIILDDVWDASVWDIINHAFPKGSHGSRIITTTQIEDVALTCCCYQSEYVFQMKPLDDDHSRKLFFNTLFGSDSNCPEQLREDLNKIVQICGGLPLATISIAGLLASQPVMSIDLLTHIHRSLSSCFSVSERTRQALNLSFNNLPHYLKSCLLSLSMCPEGYEFFKYDLVKQWVAQDFVYTTEGQDIDKVAESYLDQLIGRRFIQPICISYNSEVVSCAVHDAIHDFIVRKSVEENFIVAIDHSRKNVSFSHIVRRLSLLFGNARYAKTPTNMSRSQIRSLRFSGLFECMPCIREFKLLRVLNLNLSGHPGDHDPLDLTGISELFLLRYLKIASDARIILPNRMQGLQRLETLDVMAATRVTAIPWDIIHLPHLFNLTLPVERNLLDLIGSMGDSVSSLWSTGKLSNLHNLHLTSSSTTPPSLDHSMEALGTLLGGHGYLKTLALTHDDGSWHKDASRVIISWDGLAPPPLLQRFEFSPHSCITFSQVPQWVKELGNLCILKITVRELQLNCVDILRGLPALTALSLYVETEPVDKIIFRNAGFSVLRYFKFRCSAPWLKFEAAAMPNLEKLMLGFNAIPQMDQHRHANAVITIERMPGLKEISAKIGGAAANTDAVSALRTVVSNHQSNPKINVQLVGYSFYGHENELQFLW